MNLMHAYCNQNTPDWLVYLSAASDGFVFGIILMAFLTYLEKNRG